MYSFAKDDTGEYKKVKDINKNVATIGHKEYKDVKWYEMSMKYDMSRIKNRHYRIGTFKINRISFCCFHDKRYVLDYGIKTLSYGQKIFVRLIIVEIKRLFLV